MITNVDRQLYIQAQAKKQLWTQISIWKQGDTGLQSETYRQIDRSIDRQIDRQTDRQIDKQIDRQIDRQRERDRNKT